MLNRWPQRLNPIYTVIATNDTDSRTLVFVSRYTERYTAEGELGLRLTKHGGILPEGGPA